MHNQVIQPLWRINVLKNDKAAFFYIQGAFAFFFFLKRHLFFFFQIGPTQIVKHITKKKKKHRT